MSTQHELKLQEQLQAREEESVKKDQEILAMKGQMHQMAMKMQQQMDLMEQLQLQLKGTPKGASKARGVSLVFRDDFQAAPGRTRPHQATPGRTRPQALVRKIPLLIASRFSQ